MCEALGISEVVVCLVKRRRRVPNVVIRTGFEDHLKNFVSVSIR